ncbi:DUF2189 domain-containing protein [Methylobacterium marchantiae]|uniref:DUF2189 domain-containing protein n=1 Tax=Methylobacterium marchantiae TaxID=600331 RepID=A0ABW3X2T2_9HYPH|nr:hypothetical protein AIGOOFII_3847 [Methylobacterium marchantiae]
MTTFPVSSSRSVTTPFPIREIGLADLKAALVLGVDDFLAMPTHVLFLGLIYPLAGLFIALMAFGADLMPMIFPLASGFALIGPFAAVGLYELSRRRDSGRNIGWNAAFLSLSRRASTGLATMGIVLAIVFMAWLLAAQGLFWTLYGLDVPATPAAFFNDVLTAPRGWALMVIGTGVGFAFALIVLATSIVSIPMLVDRDVDAMTAVETSLDAFRRNPRTLAAWGCIVAALLVVGSIPLFTGLAIVMPILGHATWHLYKRLVVT